MTKQTLVVCSFAILSALNGTAEAQSYVGVDSRVVIPIVAQTGSYSSEVFVMNASSATPLTIDVLFIGANGSATPGNHDCGQIVVPASVSGEPATTSFTLAGQCALNAGSNFGSIVLQDTATPEVNQFFAYSRTQNPYAIGFSIEGFPASGIGAQSQRVIGLKRVAGPIPFQTNCFVGSFDKPISYRIKLVDSSGVILGHVDGSLLPFQMIRYLDIFAAVGAPAGDYLHYSAHIVNNNPQSSGNNAYPIYISFCTVQDNVSFGADFRIGKSGGSLDSVYNANNVGCTPSTAGCSSSYDYAITNLTHKDVFALYVRPPDTIQCNLLSDSVVNLQMQLRQPDVVPFALGLYPPGSAAFVRAAGPVVAGGTGQNSFSYDTGTDVVRVSDGASLRDFWSLEVSATAAAATAPIPYSISCISGGGTMYARPYSAAKDF